MANTETDDAHWLRHAAWLCIDQPDLPILRALKLAIADHGADYWDEEDIKTTLNRLRPKFTKDKAELIEQVKSTGYKPVFGDPKTFAFSPMQSEQERILNEFTECVAGVKQHFFVQHANDKIKYVEAYSRISRGCSQKDKVTKAEFENHSNFLRTKRAKNVALASAVDKANQILREALRAIGD